MKYMRKIATFAFALLLCLTAAAEPVAAYVAVPKVSVYADREMYGASATLKAGTAVFAESVSDGIVAVTLNGVTGYAEASAFVKAESCETYHVVADARLYASASTKANSRSVKRGTELTVVGIYEDWALVVKDGACGFMQIRYLSKEIPLSKDQITTLLVNARDVTVARDTYVYAAADSSVASVRVKRGTTLRLLAQSGEWALVYKKGAAGYMDLSALVIDNVTPAPTDDDYSQYLQNAVNAYVNTDSRVYAAAKKTAASVTVRKGTAVQLCAVKNGWAIGHQGGTDRFHECRSCFQGRSQHADPDPGADRDTRAAGFRLLRIPEGCR